MKIWIIEVVWPDDEGTTFNLGLTKESAEADFLAEMVDLDDGENPDAKELTIDDWVEFHGIRDLTISEREVAQ